MTMFQMCFADGFVHADLHPGNMVVQDDGTPIVFDVGLAKHLHEDVLIQFIDMTKCPAMGTPDDLVAHLKRFHRYLGTIDWDSPARRGGCVRAEVPGPGRGQARVRRADRRDVRDRPRTACAR